MLAADVRVERPRAGVVCTVWPRAGGVPVRFTMPPELAALLVERIAGTRHLVDRLDGVGTRRVPPSTPAVGCNGVQKAVAGGEGR